MQILVSVSSGILEIIGVKFSTFPLTCRYRSLTDGRTDRIALAIVQRSPWREMRTLCKKQNRPINCNNSIRGIAMRILSVRLAVRLSVCPSVTRVNCDKTVERSVQIFIPYER